MSTGVEVEETARRGAFSSRTIFIWAAIGSAVGLGNIWRFPYIAYENGGGAFILPYLIALLTAGIPFLYLDYALGHRYRGSGPLAFARIGPRLETLGWWQVGVCFVVAVYYAAIIAWALRYTIFAVDRRWGADPDGFFFGEFLQAADPTDGVTLDLVPGVLVPLAIVWIALLVIMGLGVQRGIGMTCIVAIPIMLVAFGALVVRGLTLPGALEGVEALFTPDWEALTHAGVWAAAFGQIFFSLSIGFGVMITYASYVDRKTDMTGSGAVVSFSNCGFELLAGIGVFAVLGFMAQAQGTQVDDVVDSGIGLAFVAFPEIMNQAPGGAILGVLFFGSLILAGLTSLMSVIEVPISAVRDKFETSRTTAVLAVTTPAALISLVLFGATSGLSVLDILDNFINKFGILVVAVVSMLVLAWGVRILPALSAHLDRTGSIKTARWWPALLAVVTPAVLIFVLVLDLVDTVQNPYEGYPAPLLAIFGWGPVVGVLVLAIIAGLTRWHHSASLRVPDPEPEVDEEVDQ